MRLPHVIMAMVVLSLVNAIVFRGELHLGPLIFLIFLGWSIFGGGLASRRNQQQRPLPPPAGPPVEPGQPSAPPPPSTSPSVDGSVWPGRTPYPGPDPAPGSMSRIEVPSYPGGSTPYAAGTASTDPVVSLARLQLARAADDLRQARQTGATAEAQRILGSLRQQGEDLRGQLEGSGSDGGRRELLAGLRGLQSALGPALREDPPGGSVDRVVVLLSAMSQDG